MHSRHLLASSCVVVLLGCSGASPVDAQLPPLASSCPATGSALAPVLLEGVTMLDMVSPDPQSGRSVLLREGRIAAIGATEGLVVPEGVVRIDGRGRWLMPGLIDGHTHERPAWPGWPDDAVGNMWLYLSNGVTTIANMGEHSGVLLGLRDSVRNGVVFGPRIFAGHFARGAADGGPLAVMARTPEEARALVQRAHGAGYDFVKVYSRVPRAAYDALVDAAALVGMPVTGHIPAEGGLANVLGHGMSNVQHAVEVWYRGFGGTGLPAGGALEAVVREFGAAGMFLTPTLHAAEMYAAYRGAVGAGRDPMGVLDAVPGLSLMDPAAVAIWRTQVRSPGYSTYIDMRPTILAQEAITRAMSAGGTPLIAGSDDIGVAGSVPGFSLIEELLALRRIGLSADAVLRAATRGPGEWLATVAHTAPELGVIRVGARADLVLLDGDPRQRIELLSRPTAVVAAGRVLSAACLGSAMDSLRRVRGGG